MPESSVSQIFKNKRLERPKNYSELVQRLGSHGRYQLNMLLVFSLIWFMAGIYLACIKFLFQKDELECEEAGLLTLSCRNLICQLPQNQRKRYFPKQKNFKSISNEMGRLYCQDEIYLTLTENSIYVGSLIGFFAFSFFSDNIGRRAALLFSLSTFVLGNIILSVSLNIPMAAIGLLLSSAGLFVSLNMTFSFFSQILQNQKRQKFSVLIQISLVIGALFITCIYLIIPNWRFVSTAFVTVPSIICLVLAFLHIQQTPQFLLKKSNKQALKGLNRIGKVNFKIKQILEQQDLISVKQNQVVMKQFMQITMTPLTLFKYGSLRAIAVCSSIISFMIYSMLYGPIMIFQQVQIDFSQSNALTYLPELIVFILIYFYIQKIKRKLAGFVTFSITVILTGALIFFKKREECDACFQSIARLVIILILRCFLSFYLCLFYIYLNQLYPIRISGLGMGVASIFGTIGYVITPIIFQALDASDVLIMMIFCVFGFIGLSLTYLLDEKIGESVISEIQQIQILKEQQKNNALQGSFRRNSFSRVSIVSAASIVSQSSFRKSGKYVLNRTQIENQSEY